VDSTLALVNDLYNHLTATEAAVQSGSKPPPSEVPVRVKAEAARLPAPMKPLLQSLTTSGASAAAGAAVGQLSQQMQTEVTGFCQKAVSGRYPLNPGSATDVTLDDFARMFAPNGLMDHFVQANLLPYVDTSKRPWTHRSVEGVGVNLSPETLLQFQRAADVRDTFFRGGSNTPSLRVDFKAVRMDPGIEQVQLEVDGQVMSYPVGQNTASSVTWPGARGGASVRLSVLPAAPTGRSVLAADGPWALLRLLDQAQITPGATPERMSASFNVGGRTVVFDVVAGSVNSPIRSAALRQFGCPNRL
jgi:type VI secretion system protein ImpL